MAWRERFWWGLFGSILPDAINLRYIVNPSQSWPDFTILGLVLFFIAVLIYMIAAGFLTVAWQPENQWKAIWVGASCQTIVATLQSVAPTPPTK